MNSQRTITVSHKNDLSAYLGDWKNVLSIVRPEEAQYYHRKGIPATFESLHNNTYDLAVVLAHLDSRLRVLEEKPIPKLDLQAYSEARVFLKAFYVFFRILLDNVSGVIEFFYKKNEPMVVVKKRFRSFHNLLKSAEKGELPEDLCKLLEQPSSWFPEVTAIRDDLVHHYDSLLISIIIDEVEGGQNILGYFNTKGRAYRARFSIRADCGILLYEYQTLIDNLLDHLDTKFRDWYGIVQGKSGRTASMILGCPAFPLWWAYKYGKYRHEDLKVSEG